jgi:anti-sigma regulatory factor (Ser/Thr protein kinase)
MPGKNAVGGLQVDLRKLRWIEPLPIAVLAAMCRDHLARNPTEEHTVVSAERREFLQRMDFFHTIGAKLPERFKRHDASGRFVPVRSVQGGADVAKAAGEIVKTLRVDDLDAANTLRHCVGEILDNVFVHARSPVDAMICAQHFPNAGRSQVAIVDTGVGFRESFTESPAYKGLTLDDRGALRLGMEPFVTSKPPSNLPYEQGYGRLGVGLFIASDVLDEVGGRILIVSGTAAVERRRGRTKWTRVKNWGGTIVGFEVPDTPNVSYADAIAGARERARALANERAKNRR